MDPLKKQRQAVKIKVPSSEKEKEKDLKPHHEGAKPMSDDEHEGMVSVYVVHASSHLHLRSTAL